MHPSYELGQPWMGSERVNRVVAARQFRLGQRGMDFAMADVVQQHHWPALAPFELGHKVMEALRHVRWDGPVTERAEWRVSV